jgi:hypothetical protein
MSLVEEQPAVADDLARNSDEEVTGLTRASLIVSIRRRGVPVAFGWSTCENRS